MIKQIRNPKLEIRRKPEYRNPKATRRRFGIIRASEFGLLSAFGFRASDFRFRSSFPSGFTLIELVISAALMSLILTAAYFCLSAALSGQRLLEPRAEV